MSIVFCSLFVPHHNWYWKIFLTGTDENAITELLGSRTNKQRVPMVAAYKTTYGKVHFGIFSPIYLLSLLSKFILLSVANHWLCTATISRLSLLMVFNLCVFPSRIYSTIWSLSSLETLRNWFLLWFRALQCLMHLNSEGLYRLEAWVVVTADAYILVL